MDSPSLVEQPNAAGPRLARDRVTTLAIGLAATAGFVALLIHDSVLFTRPLWVDEWFTVLVASHASPLDVIADLRAGADGGAGLFHLLVWAMGRVAGDITPVSLHAMSLVLVLAALGVVYATLRRRFSRDASIAGVLATGANSLVVAYAFEGRFYALWVLCTAIFAWSLGARSRLRGVIVAVAAVLLVTSHWYGVVTLAVMCAVVLAASTPNWMAGVKRVAPAAAGLVAFVAISPLAAGQQAVLTTVSWVADFRIGQVGPLASAFWFAWIPVTALGAMVFAAIRRGPDGGPVVATTLGAAAGEPGIIALLSLAAMPVALIALSLAGRPSMIGRYALPAALAWAPWAALGVNLWDRWFARVVALALIALIVVNFGSEAETRRAFAASVADNRIAYTRATTLGLPVIFVSQHAMYPLEAASRGRGSASAFLDLPDSTLDALFGDSTRFHQLNKGIRLERDFARVHHRRYDFPSLATQAALDSTPRFVLFAPADLLPRGINDITALGRALFPRHQGTPLQPSLLLLVLPAARSLPARSTSR